MRDRLKVRISLLNNYFIKLIDDLTMNSIKLRACSSSPCKNNATCIQDYNILSEFTCNCTSNLYFGSRCENKVTNLSINVTLFVKHE